MDTVSADVHWTVSSGAVNMAVHSFSEAEVLFCLRWSNAAAELLAVQSTSAGVLQQHC